MYLFFYSDDVFLFLFLVIDISLQFTSLWFSTGWSIDREFSKQRK